MYSNSNSRQPMTKKRTFVHALISLSFSFSLSLISPGEVFFFLTLTYLHISATTVIVCVSMRMMLGCLSLSCSVLIVFFSLFADDPPLFFWRKLTVTHKINFRFSYIFMYWKATFSGYGWYIFLYRCFQSFYIQTTLEVTRRKKESELSLSERERNFLLIYPITL